jgi:hypothetical protein
MKNFIIMIGCIILHFSSVKCTQKDDNALSGLGKNLDLAVKQGNKQDILKKLAEKYKPIIDNLYHNESQRFGEQDAPRSSLNWKRCAYPFGSLALGVYLMRIAGWLNEYDSRRKKHHIPSSIRRIIWLAGAYNSISSLYRFWLIGKNFWRSHAAQEVIPYNTFFRLVVAGLFIHKQACQKQQALSIPGPGVYSTPIPSSVVYYGHNIQMQPHGYPVINYNQRPTQAKITVDSDDES